MQKSNQMNDKAFKKPQEILECLLFQNLAEKFLKENQDTRLKAILKLRKKRRKIKYDSLSPEKDT